MAMRNAGGADMRILSAVNMAQLDILGQASGLPSTACWAADPPPVRVYNTTTDYWAINEMKMGPDTVKIVRFLLDRGITAMKIYPFSARDNYLSNQALDRGMRLDPRHPRPSRQRRWTSASTCWGRFDLPSAQRIAKALEPYNIMYLEDAMLMNNARRTRNWPRNQRAHLHERNDRHALRVPRVLREQSLRRDHVRPHLVRRPIGGQEDLRHGRHLFHSHFAAHLRRAAALFLLHPSLHGAPQLPHHGEQLLEVHPPVPVLRQQRARSPRRATSRPPSCRASAPKSSPRFSATATPSSKPSPRCSHAITTHHPPEPASDPAAAPLAFARSAAAAVGPMKITKVDAVRFRRDLRFHGVAQLDLGPPPYRYRA
jgi:hypothetical protein